MTNDEKKYMLMKEIDEKYKEYFEKVKKIKFKDENESYTYGDKFHKELAKYIKKRIKELEITLDTE
ncbi:MAG TPA: hypothetical protein IAB27_05240 [Candidatus Coprosoma intestinipullorum]|uniref:Uncharacterized protein n=1 Tax=Candidatus Coprosoma intestinipullorum TaxID=2840752 RepID=A0A9D1CYH3_9FIRM|nr:hypothetical protein [Candidatus Coprosoma intestinipullorum]